MQQGHIAGRIELSSKGELAELTAALDRIRNMTTKMADSLQRTASGRTVNGNRERSMAIRRAGPDPPAPGHDWCSFRSIRMVRCAGIFVVGNAS